VQALSTSMWAGHFSEAIGKRHGDGFCENQSVRDVEILRHALRVNIEPWKHFGEMMQSPSRQDTISGRVSHSACQLPRPRSCSCTIEESMVETSPGTR